MPRIITFITILLIALGCQFSIPWNDIPLTPETYFRMIGIDTYRTSDGAFIAGNRNAPITIVIFSDYSCSHCRQYNETMHMIIEEFVRTGQARIERRLIANFNPDYAKLAECVATISGDDSLFWMANDLLFEYSRGEGLTTSEATGRLANKLGLQGASLAECTITADQYLTDVAVARLADYVGTPAVRILLGTFDETDGQIPTPISGSYMSGGVDIDILRETVENANN